jgi:hypothetical protein
LQAAALWSDILNERGAVAGADHRRLFAEAPQRRGPGRRQVWSHRPGHQPESVVHYSQRIAAEQCARWFMQVRHVSIRMAWRRQDSKDAFDIFPVIHQMICRDCLRRGFLE